MYTEAIKTKNTRDAIEEILQEKLKVITNKYGADFFIAGGAIASLLIGEPPKDIDVWATNSNSLFYVLRKYQIEERTITHSAFNCSIITQRNKKNGVSFLKETGEELEPKDFHDNCGRYKVSKYALTEGEFQFILRQSGEPDDICSEFDFAHCMNYCSKDGLILSQEALESIIFRELKYMGSTTPICSLFRAYKFQKRGWNIPHTELLKIIYDISNLKLDSKKAIENNFFGLNVSFYEKLNNKKIDRNTIFELLD